MIVDIKRSRVVRSFCWLIAYCPWCGSQTWHIRPINRARPTADKPPKCRCSKCGGVT